MYDTIRCNRSMVAVEIDPGLMFVACLKAIVWNLECPLSLPVRL
jgi:hypothetical protein